MTTVFPRPTLGLPALGVVSSITEHSLAGNAIRAGGQAGASAVWPAANQARYVPVVIDSFFTVRFFWAYNGGTVSGNFDIGLLDHAGRKLLSTGSTAQSGTSTIQTVSTTATSFPPGNYILALARDNTTATNFRAAPAALTLIACGVRQQASAFPLPSTATPVDPTSAYLPIFGFGQNAVL